MNILGYCRVIYPGIYLLITAVVFADTPQPTLSNVEFRKTDGYRIANRAIDLSYQIRHFIRLAHDESQVHKRSSEAKELFQKLNFSHQDVPFSLWVDLNFSMERVLSEKMSVQQRLEFNKLLNLINKNIFKFRKGSKKFAVQHIIHPGETISRISRRYQVYPDRVIRINQIRNSNLIQVGQRLKIIPGRIKISVYRKQRYLHVWLNGLLYRNYPIAVGKNGHTPKATTKISTSLAKNPVYTNPEGKMVPPTDPDNPIGTRWIGLELGNGYGIHGTRDPTSIGTAKSNGCIRLFNENVEELYDFAMTGDIVEIH